MNPLKDIFLKRNNNINVNWTDEVKTHKEHYNSILQLHLSAPYDCNEFVPWISKAIFPFCQKYQR